jgi:hypothetical protein
LLKDRSMPNPLCFVVMPFGRKPDRAPGTGAEIDFDRVYDSLIRPGVIAAEMTPLRRRGADRRDHPQGDVRASRALRVRGRGLDHR